MRGVVMSVKGRYAVLLNKDGEFVKVRNKNYTVGSTVSVTSNTGRICALAASFLVVCGGIGSYFTPAGYVSVDINPSFLLTLNVYNKVIDIDALNDDAVILLENADVKGKNTEETVDILIKSSEEIGYINENNKDVIVEVVSGIRDVKIAEYADVEVVVEKAEKSDLRNAKEMGVSIAKAKAIKDYTTQNGGTVKDNAEKLAKKSVKEIRKGLETVADELPEITPAPTEKAKEVKVAKNSSKKKDKNPILSFIGGGNKKEEKTEDKTVESVEEKTEVKPTLPATEIFRTPAPYFEPEKEQDKEEDVKEETREENKPSFPNHFIPQIQEKPTENEKEEEKPSATQRENENRGDSKENTTDKEANAPVKDTDSSKAENQKTPDTGKQENNTSDRQENTVKTQQTDKNSGDNKSENNKPAKNESPKSENNRSESSNRNPGSGNESSNKTPSAPSAPSRTEGGNNGGGESPSRGGADKGNGGGSGKER